MKEQYYILAMVILISLFITSLCIIRHLTKQRDRLADLFKNTRDRYDELLTVNKLQREEIEKDNFLLKKCQYMYNELYNKYMANYFGSKDCM
jgi:hypothetical protein